MEEKEIKTKTIPEMNLFEKLSNITNEVKKVAKKLKVSTGSSSYKAVAEVDVLDAVKEIEYKYRVYSYPKERELEDQQIIKKISYDKEGNPKDNYTFYSKIKTIYCFINIDNPEEQITTTVFSEGIDTGDKGSGKAITYADKYSLLKAYKIETGEDPDITASEIEEETITLEEAKGLIVNFGKYKGKNKTWFDIYKTDKGWLDYVTTGETPNQIGKECLELFEEMSATKLLKLSEECNASLDSLLTKCEAKSVYDLNEDQIARAMETIMELKEKQEKSKKETDNLLTNSMLEEAEKDIKESK